MFNPIVSLTSYAAPAVVPVTADLLVELLVALGILSGTAEAGYVLSGNVDPYTATVFQNQVSTLTYDIPISEETIESSGILGNVIPENVYTYDGTKFGLVGSENELSTSDVFLLAHSLVGISYNMPTNITGANYRSGQVQDSDVSKFTAPISSGSVGSDTYYLPFYTDKTGAFIYPYAINFPTPTTYNAYDIFARSVSSHKNYENHEVESFLVFFAQAIIPKGNMIFSTSPYSNPNVNQYSGLSVYQTNGYRAIRVSGVGTTSFTINDITNCVCLTLSGEPVFSVEGDKVSLDKAVVQVKKDDKDNNGNTPPAPQSPNKWDLWKTADDLIRFIDTGEDTNGSTTLGDFVNNDYNYIDVDINMPDKVDTNVNLSGGLDVNGKGDINVTIHEDVSLPSGGDGSGFYNPDAVDAIAALTTNNPAVNVIKGLFEAIDPALVGIFSVGVSLLVVLGIWKLIRG